MALPSLQTKTVIAGLPSGTAIQVRYRAVTKRGAGDWCAPVTTVVR